ncbi:MAG: glycoside hydrolase family 73 protein [bacterium JZ-2024 1]
MKKKKEFVRKMRQLVEKILENNGWIPKEAVVAQIILETRWGESKLYQEGKNLFGIKALPTEEDALGFYTKEWDGKQWVQRVERFRKYSTEEECLRDYERILRRAPAFSSVRRAKNEEEFIREMGKLWATDPEYARKWLKLVEWLRGVEEG